MNASGQDGHAEQSLNTINKDNVIVESNLDDQNDLKDPGCTLPFLLPQSSILAGCTQSGKTHFMQRLLLNSDKMFKPAPQRVIFVYTTWQPAYTAIENHWRGRITFTTTIPTKDELLDFSEDMLHTLLVLDDKMTQLSNSQDVVDTICVLCHHRNISTFIIVQNIYHGTQAMRDISLNVQTIILFRNPRSLRQITTLASQILPGKSSFVLDAYERATETSHGYLLIDLNPKLTCKKYQFRTCIFNGEDTIVYLPQ